MKLDLQSALIFCAGIIGILGFKWLRCECTKSKQAPAALLRLRAHRDARVWVTTVLGVHWVGVLKTIHTKDADCYGITLSGAGMASNEGEPRAGDKREVYLSWPLIGAVAVSE